MHTNDSSTGSGTIVFYEIIDSLFKEVQLRTSYRSKDIKGPDGKSKFDDFAIMNSDRQMFDNLLSYALPIVFTQLAAISYGVSDSVFIQTGTPTTDQCGFELVDNEGYDENMLTIIDKRIRECYINYILKEWWGLRGLEDERQKAEVAFEKASIAMKEAAWSLIKPLMS